ncbi:sensor domain-containing protein [Mycobacterium alsense]|uniref:Sensor domain-containing protein n=2 Tax=Mycobacterium alsense TaxID=324058 RepID=A0AA41XQV8_9MYCO|nr:sensor domain-containing protein [Mycobacterium alsense]MCV7380601.1 sensor domain-containing protein [Mycobacterium alsense]
MRLRAPGRGGRWLPVVPLAAVMLAAGCAAHVGGAAQPSPSPKPRSLARQTVNHVLLNDTALARIVKQPLDIDPRFPPRFGGPEELQDAGTALPDGCLGVAAMLQQNVYPASDIEQVAVETWRHAAAPTAVTGVREAAVSLPTAADADALFAAFSQQWQECDGATTSLPAGVFRLKGTISHVQVSPSVLAATVAIGWTTPKSEPNPDPDGVRTLRAVGVRNNCLVEVEVDVFNPSRPPGHLAGESHAIDHSATDIASAMLEKVDALI